MPKNVHTSSAGFQTLRFRLRTRNPNTAEIRARPSHAQARTAVQVIGIPPPRSRSESRVCLSGQRSYSSTACRAFARRSAGASTRMVSTSIVCFGKEAMISVPAHSMDSWSSSLIGPSNTALTFDYLVVPTEKNSANCSGNLTEQRHLRSQKNSTAKLKLVFVFAVRVGHSNRVRWLARLSGGFGSGLVAHGHLELTQTNRHAVRPRGVVEEHILRA